MIAPHTLLAFAAVAAVVVVIPGPSVLFVVGRALQHGRGPALLSVVGNAAGPLVHAALVALGIGALLAASAAAFTVLKIVGGLYLIWLGIDAIRHRAALLDLDAGPAAPPSRRRLLAESFTVGVTNPKSLVFVAALLPQFVDPGAGPAGLQVMALGLVFVAIAIVSDGTYALAAAAVRQRIVHRPAALARLRAAGGVLLAGLGVAMLAARRVA